MSAFAAGARRYLLLLAGVTVATAACSSLLGLIAGTPLNRAISLGYYVAGSFTLVAGFFLGNRGPARFKGEEHGGLLGPRHVRWATLEERTSSLNDSALFVSIGFVLLLVGLVVDARVRVL